MLRIFLWPGRDETASEVRAVMLAVSAATTVDAVIGARAEKEQAVSVKKTWEMARQIIWIRGCKAETRSKGDEASQGMALWSGPTKDCIRMALREAISIDRQTARDLWGSKTTPNKTNLQSGSCQHRSRLPNGRISYWDKEWTVAQNRLKIRAVGLWSGSLPRQFHSIRDRWISQTGWSAT